MPYIWPWPKGTPISQEYGTNPGGVNPPGGHTGKDGACQVGTPLRAPADGVIVLEGWMTDPTGSDNPWLLTDGGGIVVVLDAGDTEPTFIMGHLSQTVVNAGQRVRQGDIIAYSGNTGKWTSGPHCHFEVLLPGYMIRSATYGRSNPNGVCTAYFEDIGSITLTPAGDITPTAGPGTRKVTTEGANVRLAPYDDAPTAAGYEDGLSLGAVLAVIGYVKGQEVTPGNNAWYKTKSGYFVWANAAEDNLNGLEYMGEVARPTPPPPPPAPPAPPVVVTPPPVIVVPDPPAEPEPEPASPRLHGVDVSMHQAGINLVNLAGDFVILKATEGVGYTDPQLATFTPSAATGGRLRGFYHFARPNARDGNTAAAEAAYFLSVVKPLLKAGDLLVLDWESDDIKDVAWALEWLRAVQTETGSTPVIYMNTGAVNGADWTEVEKDYPLWLASYPTNAPVNGFTVPEKVAPATWAKGYVMWQYTSSGQLAGWSGSLDLNVWFGTREDWLGLGVPLATPPVVEPAPDCPAVDEAGVLRKFADWLINQFLNRKEK